MRPATFFQKRANGQVECRLCAHYCRLDPGQTGACHVRHNLAGELLTSAYGRPVMIGVEPIEKKYLFHVLPGSQTLSLGTAGCNLGCQYCINWRVSQRGSTADEPEVSPAAVVERALAEQAACIAFTYTEPTIFFEYARDIARLARPAGLAVVAKSNGYMAPAVLADMADWLDAINIDLKGWHTGAYRKVMKGDLAPVLENLKLARRLGLWVEVSTLVTPGLNADAGSLAGMAGFIVDTLGPETPWHVQRFFPNYQMLSQPAASQTQLQLAVECGQRAGLRYVYTKDLWHGRLFNTACPGCQTVVIERAGYQVVANHLREGRCSGCGHAIPGVGLAGHREHSLLFTTLEVS